MTTDDLLKQGIAALKEGRKAEARRLLAQVVEQDARNETAWLWMSGVVDTDTERRICLKNVLAINPNNGIAKRGLENLSAGQSTSPFATVRPPAPSAGEAATSGEQPIQPLARTSEPDTADAPDETEPEEKVEEKEHEQASPPQRATKRRSGLVIGLGAGLLGIVCIAVVGVWWVTNNGLLPSEPEPTLLATADVGQTSAPAGADSTPTSSTTPPPTWTPRPTDVPPTPFPTRTPRPTRTPLLTWTPSVTPTATITVTSAATPTLAITRPPTWTPRPTITPAPGLTLPPTWTPHATMTPAPGLTLPPTWTPAYSTSTPTVTPTLILTGTLATATPGD
ncbi:MAG: hypothetical protein V3S14_18000 [Anaerolineae bacterium]